MHITKTQDFIRNIALLLNYKHMYEIDDISLHICNMLVEAGEGQWQKNVLTKSTMFVAKEKLPLKG